MRRDFSQGFARLQTATRPRSRPTTRRSAGSSRSCSTRSTCRSCPGSPAEERRARLERVLAHLISREGVILSTRERSTLVRRVVDEAVGLGVLEPLLADESISEIMINGHETVYVERFGRVERIPSGFTSEAQLLQTIDRIVSAVNRRVDESSPMVDARLPADARMPRGARVNVVLPPAVADRSVGDHPAVPQGVRAGRPAAARHPRPGERRAAVHLRPGPAEHRRLRRHRLGQDHAAERAVPVRAGPGADRHGGGRGRAVAQPGARDPAGDPAGRTWTARAR